MPDRAPLDATAVELLCPSCGRRLRASLGVVRRGCTVVGPVGHPVDLRGGRGGLPQIDRFVGDLFRAIARVDALADGSAARRGDGTPQ